MRARAHARRAGVLRAIVNAAPRDVVRVIAVCVAGARMERELIDATRARFGVRVGFVRSTRQAAGVRNGYRDTWRLGADRWVGVIAAHALARGRPALIANIGTALTLDAVTGAGRHLGGAIAPGPVTMITSLLTGTHGIRRRARGAGGKASGARSLFARDTARALESGSGHAAAALIERAATSARVALGAPPLVILTGGGGPRLRPYIKSPVRVVPDLVLRGLAVVARG
jgi:type III pantothenate kinase